MITILTWNIQNGKGIDEKISLNRIAESILNICDPDIICLRMVQHIILKVKIAMTESNMEI